MLRDRNLVPDKKKLLPISRIVTGVVLGLLLGLLMRAAIHSWVCFPYTIKNEAMVPGLKNGQSVTIWHGYKKEDLNRGDILLLQHPSYSRDQFFIARLIGLPGDQVQIHQRKVFINNQPVRSKSELAIQVELDRSGPALDSGSQQRDTLQPLILKENTIFVLSDNRLIANDSRQLGAIPLLDIRGIVDAD